MAQPFVTWFRAVLRAMVVLCLLADGSVQRVAAESRASPLNQQAPAAARALPDFADLVAQVKPAVVSVTSRLRGDPEEGDQEEGQGPTLPFPFNQFPFNELIPRPRAVEARGSGFIVGTDGSIVTNNHLVEHAVSIMVTLEDGRQLPARIVGRDPRTDIAVLKITSARPLAYLELGDSSTLRPGEWVLAMGNPFGLGGTVTVGIISALRRDIGTGPYDQFIQIDAPINPGNSGGPLFTQDGKVIGMTTAILSPSGSWAGIGFAIPSGVIKRIVPELVATGHIVRGFIGVQTQAVTPALAKVLRLTDTAGALIAGVEADSPAARAGVAVGDVIRAVNGKPVATPRDLAALIAAAQPGSRVRLDIVRNGREVSINVTAAVLPEQAVATRPAPEELQDAGLGLVLGPLLPGLRRGLNVPEGVSGAAVVEVEPGSPADDAGIAVGDVIAGVGLSPVKDPRDAARAIRQAQQQEGRAVLLRVFRDGHAAFVAIDLTPLNKG
jgi:serine protease Do